MIIKVKKIWLRYFVPLIAKLFKIKNIYLFSSYYGLYSDSPRQISEELHRQLNDAKIYWVIDRKREKIKLPSYIREIKKIVLKRRFWFTLRSGL